MPSLLGSVGIPGHRCGHRALPHSQPGPGCLPSLCLLRSAYVCLSLGMSPLPLILGAGMGSLPQLLELAGGGDGGVGGGGLGKRRGPMAGAAVADPTW